MLRLGAVLIVALPNKLTTTHAEFIVRFGRVFLLWRVLGWCCGALLVAFVVWIEVGQQRVHLAFQGEELFQFIEIADRGRVGIGQHRWIAFVHPGDEFLIDRRSFQIRAVLGDEAMALIVATGTVPALEGQAEAGTFV